MASNQILAKCQHSNRWHHQRTSKKSRSSWGWQITSPFIPNLSTLTAPLRELITDKTPFCWNATYQQALVSRLHQCPLSVTCFVLVMAELPARERAQRSSTIIRNCSNSSSQKNLDVRPNDRTRCYF